MFAYFLGGPLDLTKRATKQEPGTWMVPVKLPTSLVKQENAVVPVYKHEYRLMFREEDVLIYMYQGIR